MHPAERVALMIVLVGVFVSSYGYWGLAAGYALALVAASALYVGWRLDPG